MQLGSRWACAISAVFVLAGCDRPSAGSAPEVEQLLGPEIGKMLSGNTLATAESDDVPWMVFYEETGTEWGSYGGDNDKGRWRIEDHMLCSDWETWGDGERCFTLYRNETGEVLGYADGEQEWAARVEPGDKYDLEDD